MSTLTRFPINPRQLHWVLDWDGTITRHDTLDALVNISASTKPDFPTLDYWKRVSQAYMNDYTATFAELAPGGVLPNTVEEEKYLLKTLKAVEQRSLDRVSSSGIFSGLTAAHIEAGVRKSISSGQIGLRPGFAQYLESIRSGSINTSSQTTSLISILSVNWSQHFISSCLRTFNTPLETSTILSNELEGLQGARPSNGHIGPTNGTMIISSDDKLRCLERMKKERAASGTSIPIVYVGDSWTDIECLLAADLGICVRDEPIGSSQRKLAEALDRLGIKCPRLADWREADDWKVVWVRDFVEIRDWYEGLNCAGE
ncbi:Nn.00g099170.m01.CDS01 [Neocucurbitaria sp. VM-36]